MSYGSVYVGNATQTQKIATQTLSTTTAQTKTTHLPAPPRGGTPEIKPIHDGDFGPGKTLEVTKEKGYADPKLYVQTGDGTKTELKGQTWDKDGKTTIDGSTFDKNDVICASGPGKVTTTLTEKVKETPKAVDTQKAVEKPVTDEKQVPKSGTIPEPPQVTSPKTGIVKEPDGDYVDSAGNVFLPGPDGSLTVSMKGGDNIRLKPQGGDLLVKEGDATELYRIPNEKLGNIHLANGTTLEPITEVLADGKRGEITGWNITCGDSIVNMPIGGESKLTHSAEKVITDGPMDSAKPYDFRYDVSGSKAFGDDKQVGLFASEFRSDGRVNWHGWAEPSGPNDARVKFGDENYFAHKGEWKPKLGEPGFSDRLTNNLRDEMGSRADQLRHVNPNLSAKTATELADWSLRQDGTTERYGTAAFMNRLSERQKAYLDTPEARSFAEFEKNHPFWYKYFNLGAQDPNKLYANDAYTQRLAEYFLSAHGGSSRASAPDVDRMAELLAALEKANVKQNDLFQDAANQKAASMGAVRC